MHWNNAKPGQSVKRSHHSHENDRFSKSNFSPSGILQSFGFPLPFRKRNKPKDSPSRSQVNRSQTLRPRELIELANFGLVELDPVERGLGHDFQPASLKNPTWCDRCGDLIWGLYSVKEHLRCQYCRFTCHVHCRDRVSLDCQGIAETNVVGLDPVPEAHDVPTNGVHSPVLCIGYFEEAELRKRILAYNQESQGLTITMENDQSFHGFVRVHLHLTRPINVVAGSRPPSIFDILKEEEDTGRKTLTSFYLPHDTVKALHITGDYTTKDVIAALLKKFKVIDNPHKFALYERYKDSVTNRVVLRRIPDSEKPLLLALLWCGQDKQFFLQENETEDIMWEQFALAELQNFLKILDREEEEYLKQVKRKYQLMQMKIAQCMQALGFSAPCNGLTHLSPEQLQSN